MLFEILFKIASALCDHVCFDLGLHRSLEKSVMSNLKNSGGGFPSRNMVCEKIDFFLIAPKNLNFLRSLHAIFGLQWLAGKCSISTLLEF